MARVTDTPTGYVMHLSTADTHRWANRPRASWPCSTLAGKRCRVDVDANGLYGLTVNGRDAADIDGIELDAIVGDHLPARLRNLWPCWEASADASR